MAFGPSSSLDQIGASCFAEEDVVIPTGVEERTRNDPLCRIGRGARGSGRGCDSRGSVSCVLVVSKGARVFSV